MNTDVIERKSYRPGETLFSQGEMGEEAFLVEDGTVEIARAGTNAELVMATVGEGGLIGEMALLDKSPRMATARAMKKTTCIVIPKKVFDALLKESNPILVSVLMTLMQRLRGEADKNTRSTIG